MYKNIHLNLLEKKWKEESYETLEVDISEKVKKLIKIIPKKREKKTSGIMIKMTNRKMYVSSWYGVNNRMQ